jgi:MFS superfamily sulfate permease-like transporter
MALVGLIESLLTLNLVDDLTETTGQPNRESVGQGVANTLTGLFGGMGGCMESRNATFNRSNITHCARIKSKPNHR